LMPLSGVTEVRYSCWSIRSRPGESVPSACQPSTRAATVCSSPQ
jgi:hypothetical protein